MIHSSPKENNRKRTNNKGKVPIALSKTVLSRPAETTASPPQGICLTRQKSFSNAASPSCERKSQRLSGRTFTTGQHSSTKNSPGIRSSLISRRAIRRAARRLLLGRQTSRNRHPTGLHARKSARPSTSFATRWDFQSNRETADLVMHIAGVDFSVACRSLADEFRPLAAGQAERAISYPGSWSATKSGAGNWIASSPRSRSSMNRRNRRIRS